MTTLDNASNIVFKTGPVIEPDKEWVHDSLAQFLVDLHDLKMFFLRNHYRFQVVLVSSDRTGY